MFNIWKWWENLFGKKFTVFGQEVYLNITFYNFMEKKNKKFPNFFEIDMIVASYSNSWL